MKVSLFFHCIDGGAFANLGTTLVAEFIKLGIDAEAVVSTASAGDLSRATIPVTVLHGSGPRSVLSLARYLRERRPDVLFSMPTSKNLIALLARRLSRTSTRVIISEHTTLSDELFREHRGDRKMQLVYPSLIRMLYPGRDGLVSPTKAVLRDPVLRRHVALDAKPVAVISNPVPSRPPSVSSGLLHPWLAEDRQMPVVVGVGRLSVQKGFDFLIEAVEKLVIGGAPVRALIFGEGPSRAELEALIEQKGLSGYVELRGFAANVPAVLAAADAFVLSSRWEAFGLVLVEAMAAGTPIVSTRLPGGPEELLQHETNAILVDPEDASALAAGIDRVVQDAALARRLAGQGLEDSQKYLPSTIAKQYVAFFESALAAGNATPASRTAVKDKAHSQAEKGPFLAPQGAGSPQSRHPEA